MPPVTDVKDMSCHSIYAISWAFKDMMMIDTAGWVTFLLGKRCLVHIIESGIKIDSRNLRRGEPADVGMQVVQLRRRHYFGK